MDVRSREDSPLTPTTIPTQNKDKPVALDTTDLNATSTESLEQVVTVALAAAIVKERGENGPYTSMANVKVRCKGMGAKKFTALAEAGYRIPGESRYTVQSCRASGQSV